MNHDKPRKLEKKYFQMWDYSKLLPKKKKSKHQALNPEGGK